MFTKRTIIGIIIGSAIIGIGAAALVTSIGVQTLDIEEKIEVGKSLPYTITAPAGTPQSMTVSGDRFDLELASPGGGYAVPLTSYEKQQRFDWTHEADGTTTVRIQNTGNGELTVGAVLKVSTDPILFAYHFIVITAGVVIIGFSLGFSIRKPRGF